MLTLWAVAGWLKACAVAKLRQFLNRIERESHVHTLYDMNIRSICQLNTPLTILLTCLYSEDKRVL